MMWRCFVLFASGIVTCGQTPKLKITLKNDTQAEQAKRTQLERIAAQYNLKKFTLTKDILIEQGVMNHSKPVLTLNPGFPFNDDRALSVYIHEQGHWLLGEHQNEMRGLYQDLTRTFPGMPANYPEGSGSIQDSYFHLAVIGLEWNGLEEVVGEQRARTVLEFLSTQWYTVLYKTVLENRQRVNDILQRHGLRW